MPAALCAGLCFAGSTAESQAQLTWRALENHWDPETFVAELAAQTERRRSSLAR